MTAATAGRREVSRSRRAGTPPRAWKSAWMGPTVTARAATEPQDDLVLGRYRLARRLGAGAYGTVHLAHDEMLDRDVAVKVVELQPGGERRARREVLAAARLSHPGIVTLYEAGEERREAYLVSELVRGRTLGGLMADGLLSDRDVARIGAALCDALGHAHAQGVVHRDVKPQNVIVPDSPESGAGIVKLTDFGVARLAGSDPLTRTGDVVGTLAYMAPEQAEGRPAGPAADLYSLALVLYEGLAGRNPVRAGSPAATARRLGSPLPPLAGERPDLPEGLAGAVDGALDPDPDLRGDVSSLRAALAAAAPLLSDAPGLVAPARERSPSALLTRVAAGVAAGGLVWLVLATLAPQPPSGGAPLWAAAAAIATALLPRLGWALSALGLVAWLVRAGVPGSALMIAAAAIPVPLLLPRSGALWSLPAAAPALGIVGLAGAQPGLATAAGPAARRCAVAALGFLWLSVAELLSGRHLYLGPPPGASPVRAWRADAGAAATDALAPLASSGLLAVAVVWALAALVLPWLVRGRRLELDIVLAAAWAGGTASASAAVVAALGASHTAAEPRSAVVGALAGAAFAVAWRRRPWSAGTPVVERSARSGGHTLA